MSFEGVSVNKLNGGLGGTNPSSDGVCLLAIMVATADLPVGVTHYQTIECLQPEDLEAAGFDAAFDANEHYLVYDEVSEFFRLSPSGKLHVMAVPPTHDVSGTPTDNTPVYIMSQPAFMAAVNALPEVKIIGFAGFPQTVTDVDDLVEGIQTQINAFATEHRLIDAVIVGAKGTATATLVSAYPDLRAKNAPNVSVAVAQDPFVATQNAAYAKYAAVGAVLGMLSVRRVNENLGSVDIIDKPSAKKADPDYPLSYDQRWASANLSDGTPVSTLSLATQKSLSDKGYIFAGSYNGYGGTFFNDSPTCVEEASDYNRIENNRTWNKAARLIRNTLLPQVKGIVKKNPVTGNISDTTISHWMNLLQKKVRDVMMAADEVSGMDFYINPAQNPGPSTPVNIRARVVKDGIVHEFSVDLGLVNSLQ